MRLPKLVILIGLLFFVGSCASSELPPGLSEVDGQFHLTITDGIPLPVDFSRNVGTVSNVADSTFTFVVRNRTSSSVGNGSITAGFGVTQICACEGGSLNLGAMDPNACMMVVISLDEDTSGEHEATLSLMGILTVSVTGAISSRAPAVPPKQRDLIIGGDCSRKPTP